MAMMASPRATIECVTAFGMTDFTADVAQINLPTLVVHGTADKIVPIAATAHRMAKMVPSAKLIEYDNARTDWPPRMASGCWTTSRRFWPDRGQGADVRPLSPILPPAPRAH